MEQFVAKGNRTPKPVESKSTYKDLGGLFERNGWLVSSEEHTVVYVCPRITETLGNKPYNKFYVLISLLCQNREG